FASNRFGASSRFGSNGFANSRFGRGGFGGRGFGRFGNRRFGRGFGFGCWGCGFGWGGFGLGFNWGWGGFGFGWGSPWLLGPGWGWGGYWGTPYYPYSGIGFYDPSWGWDSGYGYEYPSVNYDVTYPPEYSGDGSSDNYSSGESSPSSSTENAPSTQPSDQSSPNTNADTGNVAVSTPTILLYLKDGTMYTATDYWLADHQLHYIVNYSGENTVDIGQVDLQRTVDENAKRGVTFTLKPRPDGNGSGVTPNTNAPSSSAVPAASDADQYRVPA
ncbi:MAG: hypothetical protein ACREAC_31630, partial [Blastocatellia bacterium]